MTGSSSAWKNHVQLTVSGDLLRAPARPSGRGPTPRPARRPGPPGVLPVNNKAAVDRAIRFGLAVGAKVAPLSSSRAKNYFYPDLPRAARSRSSGSPWSPRRPDPLLRRRPGEGGEPDHAHLEEDARRNLHEDLPRHVGHRQPEPCRHAAAGDRLQARCAARRAVDTRAHPACPGDDGWGSATAACGKGSFRCDVNVSTCASPASLSARAANQEPQQLPLPGRRGELQG